MSVNNDTIDWQNEHERLLSQVKEKFPDAVQNVYDFRGERTLIIGRENLIPICELLRDDEGLQFNLLEDIVADDMLLDGLPDEPRFAVNYHLYSIPRNHRIRLRVPVEDPEEGPPTLAGLWPVASWLELEVWDLMGVQFAGNRRVEMRHRLFLPEDWQGHPLRKDYPLGYEEVQFSFNWQEIDAKKPYAKE